ncbi:MAG: hypothetical protein AAF821_11590 [Cyanobacteria bacterium P01_D01_bin.156]
MLKFLANLLLGSLTGLLGMFAISVSTLAQEAIVEQQTETLSVNVTVEADRMRDYGQLMGQVVGRANDAIANAFETNPDTKAINATVLISRNGQVLPILVAEISRDAWQQQPDVQSWARYSTSVRSLLGYAPPARTATRTVVDEPSPHQAFLEREALIDQLD